MTSFAVNTAKEVSRAPDSAKRVIQLRITLLKGLNNIDMIVEMNASPEILLAGLAITSLGFIFKLGPETL